MNEERGFGKPGNRLARPLMKTQKKQSGTCSKYTIFAVLIQLTPLNSALILMEISFSFKPVAYATSGWLTPETCLPSVAWKAKVGHLKPYY